MRGIADGAGRELLDIVALNVRTEINFGLFSDGCTSLAWHTEDRAWLAQNWDVGYIISQHQCVVNENECIQLTHKTVDD